ncbi:TPA: hypothetical protein QCU10_005827 [Bacillus anthracis]|nr:hypothetical protein [Bacillus cereus biovar anthracis]HDR6230947.1 hypothetical protein [Bacillus cereus biovar anthracis]HDR6240474.1 hypothetical protein [Bacillus cereus biovar anthracis]HDR6252418.1 hypothetical protein [Bacillus cereus biovar anthracis]HDR6254203.1 hypothetical protein [Bacillus cereus biovar anthracis]
MNVYKGIEAYKALEEGKILEFSRNPNYLFRMSNGNVFEKKKGNNWALCRMILQMFVGNVFVEYKEQLKYKVGDEVWVKAKIKDVRTDQNYAYPYVIEEVSGYYKEEELKEIDE